MPINWEDPNVPVGDAPPYPKWPLAFFGTLWMGWVVFLAYLFAQGRAGQ